MTKRVLVLSATTVVLLVGLTLSADASMFDRGQQLTDFNTGLFTC